MMEETSELIINPFKCTKKSQTNLYRTFNGFEMRFSSDIFSKKIQSSVKANTKKYLEIEAADFYLPETTEAKQFYSSMYKQLLDPNLSNFEIYSEKLLEYLENNRFPDLNLPKISVSSHYENYKPENSNQKITTSFRCVHIQISDPIPTCPTQEIISKLVERKGMESFKTISEELSNLIKDLNIFRFSDFKEVIGLNAQLNESPWIYKPFLGLFCYLYTNGPWRGYWVKFGYNPKSDPQNYKFQIVESRTHKYRICIQENLEIIKEVERRPDWYLLKEFDMKAGFLSNALFKFIEFAKNSKTSVFTEVNEESDFDIFD